MRKLIFVTVLAAALAAPAAASAFFTPHFSVLGKGIEQHRTHRGGFAFKDNLLDPANPSNSVGHDQGRCTPRDDRALHCRATIFLNGELGGDGTIHVKGNLTRGSNRVNVTGGSGDFNGAAGKLVVESQGRHTDLLTFDLVK
jgi:hypothetical protein